MTKDQKYQKKYYQELKKSNQIGINVDLISKKCIDYAYEIINENYEYAENLIQCLSKCYKIPKIKVNLHIKPRPVSRSNTDLFGQYTPSSPGKQAQVDLWILTRHKILVGPNEFMRTIIEEWIHHWDMKVLKFEISPHTKGFKKRIREVMRALQVRIS